MAYKWICYLLFVLVQSIIDTNNLDRLIHATVATIVAAFKIPENGILTMLLAQCNTFSLSVL